MTMASSVLCHIMKRLILALGICSLLVATGCSSIGGVGVRGGEPISSGSVAEHAWADSLAGADNLYREALARYVVDEWQGAGELLDRAVRKLDSIDPAGDSGLESSRASLKARAEYFLAVVARNGYERSHAETIPAPRVVDIMVETLAEAIVTEQTEAGAVEPVITIVVNSRVEKWLDYFQGRGHSVMQKWLDRRSRYQPMVEEIFGEAGLPKDLFYLALIESGLNPRAYSRAHAAGMWQFISSRARMNDLKVDWWVDERRDPEKATRAAAAYLAELHDMFGSWELALAGYNSGEGRVAKAQRRRPSCPDYWCLDLPSETENFVPKFMAAVLIGNDPEAYGFAADNPGEAVLEYDSMEVTEATDLSLIAASAGTSVERIRELNPALRRWCTPPSASSTTVRVPLGTAELCISAIADVPESERVTWQRHRITRGETLSEIAGGYGTSISAIMSVNDLRSAHRIYPGDYLIIPIGPDGASAAGRYSSGTDDVTHYRVRRGDTISSIARRHGKSTRAILRTNGLGWNSRIYPGDTIRIPM